MRILLFLLLGGGVGCVGGMVGIGGGVLLIPALTELFKVDPGDREDVEIRFAQAG